MPDGSDEEFNNLLRAYWSDQCPDHPQHPPQQVCLTSMNASLVVFCIPCGACKLQSIVPPALPLGVGMSGMLLDLS